MAPLFQAREIPRIVPSLPPVKRLAADTEVATGQRRILSMPPVMVQPLQSCFCQPADPLDPAYHFGTRSSRTYYLHDDTILSVTYHYEREQLARSRTRRGPDAVPGASPSSAPEWSLLDCEYPLDHYPYCRLSSTDGSGNGCGCFHSDRLVSEVVDHRREPAALADVNRPA